MDLRVPELAEGVKGGTLVNILVKEGDTVRKGQDVLEIETEKAMAAVPSPGDGVVEKILVQPGTEVQVGQVIFTIKEGQARPQQAATQPEEKKPEPETAGAAPKPGGPPVAPPSVRNLARLLNLDLSKVRGTERGGRISLEDVQRYVAGLEKRTARPAADLPDFSKFGPVRTEPLSALRKKIAERMAISWTTVPHVTQFDEIDVAKPMALAKKHGFTLTVLILKALARLLKRHAIFNASIDETAGRVVYKDYVHIGIAVDTPQGLIVPVLRDVDKKDLAEIAKELAALAERTRRRKVGLDELQGSSFTVSNQGGIGGGHFTPIVNTPDAAILGIGRAAERPVVRDKKVTVRPMLPVTLSYDHRLIDGADAARFMKALVEEIEGFKIK